jgi:hypothetical protein
MEFDASLSNPNGRLCIAAPRLRGGSKHQFCPPLAPRLSQSLFDTLTLETCEPLATFSEERYLKHLLAKTEEWELFLICWKQGQCTTIHDHPEGGCKMRVLRGALIESEYSFPTIAFLSSRVIGTGCTGFKKGQDILHSIEALEDTISLHLYYPPGHVTTSYNRPNLPLNIGQYQLDNALAETTLLPIVGTESSQATDSSPCESTTLPV